MNKYDTITKTLLLFQATAKMAECLNENQKGEKLTKQWINQWIKTGKTMQRFLENSTLEAEVLNEISFKYMDVMDKLCNYPIDKWDEIIEKI